MLVVERNFREKLFRKLALLLGKITFCWIFLVPLVVSIMSEGALKTSHHDVERQGVGVTAHVVAVVRAIETSRGEGVRLINDPFAEPLAGEIGQNYLFSYSRIGIFLLGSTFLRNAFWLLSPLLRGYPELGMLDGLPIRTRNIDDEIRSNLINHGIEQICVLGAGLDARPWRLKQADIFQQSANPQFQGNTLSRISYFEYDFPELFEYKLKVLEEHQASSDFNYVKVESDLSLPNWEEKLLEKGFQPEKRTMWILEGFTGYLTEEEFRRLFDVVSNKLSAPGSRFIITFVKPTAARLPVTKNMHKFRPANPVEIITSFGWEDGKEESFEEAGLRLGREIYPVGSTVGHVFVTAKKS